MDWDTVCSLWLIYTFPKNVSYAFPIHLNMLHVPTIPFLYDLTLPSKFGVRHIPKFSPVSYYLLFLRPKASSQHFGSHRCPIQVIPIDQKTLSHAHSKQKVDLLTGMLTESVAELSLHCRICEVTQLSGNCACLPGRKASCGSFNHLLQFLALSSPLLCLNVTVTRSRWNHSHCANS